jgi:hypothetical protein
MKDLRFICVQPCDTYYTWQVHAWIESLKELGYSDKATVIVFTPGFRQRNTKWDDIVKLYPEVEFVFYRDNRNDVTNKLAIYIPILRPWCLTKYFADRPEMKYKAIFYCDSDVLFTKNLDIQKFLNDDICYLSDTNSYINASYFDSKEKDVLPEKLEEYKKIDVLNEAASIVGINREICEKNNLHSGGAQYLLKNIDAAFWAKVYNDCVLIRRYLISINKKYFANENKGFQGWCSDMWAVLWNLWNKGHETKVVKELDFAWATDPLSKLANVAIFHNAGIVSDTANGYPAFYKGKYHQGSDPFKDPHINIVLENEQSKKYCTHFYLTHLMKIKEKYKLEY